MTKPNGRGRGWRKKTWDTLTPSTRKKYERYGISEEEYAGGMTISEVDRWVRDQMETYDWRKVGPSEYEMDVNGETRRTKLSALNKRELLVGIRLQRQMEGLYVSGQVERAAAMWEQRPQQLPEWLFFYHGMFN